MAESVLVMFSSKSFMVYCLIFKSLSHFQFIFVYGVRVCSSFIDLHVAVQLSQHHLLKRLSFPHCILLPLLSKTNWRTTVLDSSHTDGELILDKRQEYTMGKRQSLQQVVLEKLDSHM